MNDVFLVRRFESGGDFAGDTGSFNELERTLLDARSKRLPLDVLHSYEGAEIVVFGAFRHRLVDLVDARDIRVVELSRSLSLAVESFAVVFTS